LYCPNPACPKRLLHRLDKWLSVLEIREIGAKLLSRLFDSGRLTRVADLYTLTAAELADLERMGELSAAKVERNLRAVRELTLARFVAGFDIEGVAETIMDKVALAGFDTLEKLRAADAASLSAVHGLGDITARTIVEGLAETAADMDAVLAAGFVAIASPLDAAAAPLRGLSFCFTGELASLKRSAAEAQAKRYGGVAKGTVSRDLSFLVTNDPASGSAKSRKAEQYGVRILDEAAFLKLIADAGRGVAPPEAGGAAGGAAGAGSEPDQGDLFGGGGT
jgi:DNA ligase (NAD+)